MLERPNRGIWKWSLLTACILTGLFYVLNYTGLFSQRFGYFFVFTDSPPAVTISMVTSEFIASLSRVFSHWNWVTTSKIIIALLLYFVTAWWIARRRASVKAAILAGLWAGLFYGLIGFIISSVLFIGYLQTFRGDPDSSVRAYSLALIVVDDVSSFLFGFVLYGLLPGIVGGVLGGLCGWLTKSPLLPLLSAPLEKKSRQKQQEYH